MSLQERTAKAAAWSTLGMFVQVLVSFAALAVIARILGPEPFGTTAAAWVFVGLASVLVNSSLNESLFNHERPERGHYDAMFWMLLPAATVFAGIIALLRHPIAEVMGIPELATILPVSVLVLPVSAAFTVQESLLIRDLRLRAVTHAGNAGAIAASVVGTAAALSGFGIWSLVAMPLVNVAVRLLAILPVTRWYPGFRARWRHVRDLGPFGLTVAGIRLAEFAEKALPRAVVGMALGAEALGHYSLAWRFYEQLSVVLKSPLTKIAMPAVVHFRSDPDALRLMLQRSNRLVSVVATPCFAGLLAVAPIALPLLVGPQWVPSAVLLQAFCVIGIQTAMATFQPSVMRGVGRPGDHLKLVLAQLVVAAAVTPPAAMFGLLAVALATAARHVLEWPFAAALVARPTRDTVWGQLRVVLPALGAASAMALGVTAFITVLDDVLSPVVLLLAAVPLGVVLYLLALALVAPATVRTLYALALAGARRDGEALRAVARSM